MAAAFPRTSILLIALAAMGIAVLLPFDQGLRLISGGHLPIHVLLIGTMALSGGWFAQKGGLSSAAHLRPGLLWALGMAAYVLLLDLVVARPLMLTGALAYVHMPLPGRLTVFMARAFNESVIYRLFLFGGLIAVLQSRLSRPLPPMVVLAAALVAQLANIGINLGLGETGAIDPALLLYWLLRYVLPGVVWGWLYWRHGFVTTEIASTGVHLFLQPVIGVLV